MTAYGASDKNKLKWVETVSRLMDSQFRLPGTSLRFGLDPLLGIFPAIGQIPTFGISIALIITMAKHGASRNLVIRMVFNIILDLLIGSIPIIGTIFDVTYKANDRNVRLLQRHYQEGKYQGSGSGFLLTVLVITLVLFGLILYGIWKFSAFIYHAYIQ